jgi:hypothetical protein
MYKVKRVENIGGDPPGYVDGFILCCLGARSMCLEWLFGHLFSSFVVVNEKFRRVLQQQW